VGKQHPPTSKACLNCAGDVCALVPPTSDPNPFCYEGTNSAANDCFNNDIAVSADATPKCGKCSDYGYGKYLRNDPIYTEMGLWSTKSLRSE